MTVGLFDSGAGGLCVLDVLRQRMPEADFLYLADTAHFPYGPQTPEQVRAHARQAVATLIEKGASQVVVACNTASAHLEGEGWPVPVIKIIEPTARACASYQRVGVIATQSTIDSGAYQQRLGDRCAIALACPELVTIAEESRWDEALARQQLRPLIGQIDALLLGCTHYGLLRNQIQALVGNIPLIGAEAIEVTPVKSGSGVVHYYATGERRNHQMPPTTSTIAPSSVNVREGRRVSSTQVTSTSR